MSIKVTFEGEADEIAKLFPKLREAVPDASVPNSAPKADNVANTVADGLSRRPLSEPRRRVIEELVKAFPNDLTTEDLAGRAGVTREQIGPINGILSSRMTGTKGFPMVSGQRPIRLLIDKLPGHRLRATKILCDAARAAGIVK